jgi:hypothetical protein
MKNLTTVTLTLLVSALLLASPAYAAPGASYGVDLGSNHTGPRPNSDSAALSFDTATGATSLINFESAPLGLANGLTIAPGVTLTAPSTTTIINSPINTPEEIYGYNTTSGGAKFAEIYTGSLTFNFATPIDAFGAYFTGVQNPLVSLTFNDGSSQVIPFSSATLAGGIQFLGFIDSGAQISSVTIDAVSGSHGDAIAIDDVRYRTVAVPESSTVLLLGLGLGGLLALRRRLGRLPNH